jgi:hypothetical protein
VLRALRVGEIRTIARDLPEPSPLAHALLNSQPYTFLDAAPLEERRARAVQVRRGLPAEEATGLGALDASAIEQVVADARPLIRDAEELHDWLLSAVLVPAEGVPTHLLAELVATGRAARLTVSTVDPPGLRNEVFGTSVRESVVCTERVLHVRALFRRVSSLRRSRHSRMTSQWIGRMPCWRWFELGWKSPGQSRHRG